MGTPAAGAASTVSNASVIVTFHGWNANAQEAEVGGYVADVIESGGTCTLTLTHDAARVVASSTATPDATTTACGAVTVPGAQLGAGTWQAVLTYQSPKHAGSAAPVAITVTR